MRISAAIAAVVLALVVIVVPQGLGAQPELRISFSSSSGGLLNSPGNITLARDLPDSVHPGETFNITVNFTSPADNFSNVYLIDHAPSGWTVTVQPGWCSPAANWVGVTNNATDNCVEIFWWLDTYPQGTNFTVRYEVTVPGNASVGNYNFIGTLDFVCDPDNTPGSESVGGDGTIAVYLSGSPQLSFTPTALSFHGVEGGPNPLDAILRIWNSGGEVLNWSVNYSAPWLSMNPLSGSSTGEIDRVNVSVNTSGMGEGQNQTNITITPEGANATLIPVSLTIIPPSNPMRNLSPLQVYPGHTFDVGVNWTLNPTLTKNVSGIGLVDNTSVTNATGAKFYWGAVRVNETPAATDGTVRGTNNTSVEYLWDGNISEDTPMSVTYTVLVPGGTTPGLYYMTVCPDASDAWLEYYVGEDAYIECIGGDWQVEVLSPAPGGGGGGAAPPPPPPPCCPCDVNCDGFYDARDLTEEHRIILLLDAPTEGADCTQDGVIDARDVTGVKRAILGICCGPCDPNCDGSIDARDVTKICRIIAGIDEATPGADCNGDGKVDARDLVVIKQIVVEVQKQPQPVTVPPCGCVM